MRSSRRTVTARVTASLVVALAATLVAPPVSGIDAPHDAPPGPANCSACHDTHAAGGMALIATEYVQDLCVSCHDGVIATEASTHANPITAESPWCGRDYDGCGQDIVCTDCHDPHGQKSALGEHFVGYADASGNNILRRSPTGAVPILYDATGVRSAYVKLDADGPYGVCEACHTQTDVFYKGGTLAEHAGTRSCLDCHSHRSGFQHSAGSDCGECHGHDPGYGGATGGAGTFQVHSTHTEADTDDIRGPNIACETCHDILAYPDFADGATSLAATAVCDDCHSPSGDYDGVDDPIIGAKANWFTGGVYDGATLLEGKERWCAGCHDDEPATSGADGSGVEAPSVAGEETEATSYGTGYGYYRTGHGLPAEEQYPASGRTVPGADLGCDACHDPAARHIDGVSRSYDPLSPAGSDGDYQHGYRLKDVGGELPLVVPRKGICGEVPPVKVGDFLLCFQCHDSGPFTSASDYRTSFRRADTPDVNAHYYHLSVNDVCGPGPMFSSDWSYTGWDSRATCVTCHNVHGSAQPSMVRDGELVDREPGLQMAYYDPSVSYACGSLPTPADVSLPASTGTVWNKGETTGFCGACHGSCGYDALYLRTPYDGIAPRVLSVYGRTGSDQIAVRFSEPVYSDPTATTALEPADMTFSDATRTITGVDHTAGELHAVLSLSSALSRVGTDTVRAASPNTIFDIAGNAMAVLPVIVLSDETPPELAAASPADGASDVPVDEPVSFVLTDEQSGTAWDTFTLELSGDGGYYASYGPTSPEVAASADADSYFVTVTPGVPYGYGEQITVAVHSRDRVGNELATSWLFTTVEAGTPQSVVLHPSGLNANPGAYSTLPVADTWGTSLDSDDADASYATSTSGAPGAQFSVLMDDTPLVEGTTVTSVTIYVAARYVDGFAPTPPCSIGSLDIGFDTGAGVLWDGTQATPGGCAYTILSTATYTTDSGGGALDAADIQALIIAVSRQTGGSKLLRITEIFAEVLYVP